MTAKTPEPLDLAPYKAWADAPWGPEPDTASEMVAALVGEVQRLRAEVAVLEWRLRRERAETRTTELKGWSYESDDCL